ncbi:hypothetical protein B0H34DRAFT_690036 [Crassisporium funariophilum]|nr:hypothetical protein B0H34DRAFT_690036 [Crassisporium funariophilum]
MQNQTLPQMPPENPLYYDSSDYDDEENDATRYRWPSRSLSPPPTKSQAPCPTTSQTGLDFESHLLDIPGPVALQLLYFIFFYSITQIPLAIRRARSAIVKSMTPATPLERIQQFVNAHGRSPSPEPSSSQSSSDDSVESEFAVISDPDAKEPDLRIPITNIHTKDSLSTLHGSMLRIYRMRDADMDNFARDVKELGLHGQVMRRPLAFEHEEKFVKEYIVEDWDGPRTCTYYVAWFLITKDSDLMRKTLRWNRQGLVKAREERNRKFIEFVGCYFLFGVLVGLARLAYLFYNLSWVELMQSISYHIIRLFSGGYDPAAYFYSLSSSLRSSYS